MVQEQLAAEVSLCFVLCKGDEEENNITSNLGPVDLPCMCYWDEQREDYITNG